ncbi:MAG TPA: cell division protein SepF [Enterococcus columbae]|nr:cell division protein SepF [Enterococcus columbae]
MGIFDRISTFFGMGDDDYEYDEYEEMESADERPVQKPITNKVNPSTHTSTQNAYQQAPRSTNYRRPTASQTTANAGTFNQSEMNQRTKEVATPNYQQQNVVSMQQRSARSPKISATKNNQGNKIIIIEPRAYSEAMKIAKHIMNGESVLINFHQIEEYQARRIVDFLTGTVYAQNGDIKRVGNEIFLCTAQGVEIDGTAQSLMDTSMLEIQ